MATNSSASGFNYAQTLIPIFDDESYDFWSIQMKTLFISQELWELVENGYDVPESTTALQTWSQAKPKEYKENKKKDTRALLFIQQGISKAIFPRILGAKKLKEAWDIMKEEFQGTEKVITTKFNLFGNNLIIC